MKQKVAKTRGTLNEEGANGLSTNDALVFRKVDNQFLEGIEYLEGESIKMWETIDTNTVQWNTKKIREREYVV